MFKAARDSTKHELPNTADFDGVHDGRLSDTKLCGCTGPRSATKSTTTDATALLMAAMLPLLTGHLGNLVSNVNSPPPIQGPSLPTTPSRACKMIAAQSVGMLLHSKALWPNYWSLG